MSKAPSKRNSRKATKKSSPRPTEKHCQNCDKDLSDAEKALFVEEEIGRVFCSEDCITEFFTPVIEKMEAEYHKNVEATGAKNEFTQADYDALSHLRWITLEEPDEIWRKKTKDGDVIYTLISAFQPGGRSVWCISMCLMLRGEPSFMFISFPTGNMSLVQIYRKGEQVERKEIANQAVPQDEEKTDRLAGEWTPDETLRAQYPSPTARNPNDIPRSDYPSYHDCLQETLDAPNEVWSIEFKPEKKLYHFIRNYAGNNPYWYIIIARDTEEPDQLEILDAFPTRDANLMKAYQSGLKEMGGSQDEDSPGLLH